MKTLFCFILCALSIVVGAQTNLGTQHAAPQQPNPAHRIDAQQVRALRQPTPPASQHQRSLQSLIINYDGVDELNTIENGGTYQRFIWELNTNYDEFDTNRFALTWAALVVDTFVGLDSIGNIVSYPRKNSDIDIDSIELPITHENLSGTPDTIRVSIYDYAGTFGLQLSGPDDAITNTVLWDTMIITTTSLSPAANQPSILTVYPGLGLSYPNNRYVVGVHFFGDTTQNTFTLLAGYGERCGGSCFATPSTVDSLNSLWRMIAWAGGNNLTGVNAISYDCNQNGIVGEPAACEAYPIQNFLIASYMRVNSPITVVTGSVFHDANTNCLRDGGETILPGYKIQVDGNPNRYFNVGTSGTYLAYFSDTGAHTLRLIDNHPYTSPLCPPGGAQSVHIPTLDTTYGNVNFGVKYDIACPRLEVDIASGLLRPCRDASYFISYCNTGTVPATNAYIRVNMPGGITVSSSTIPWRTPQSGANYDFDLGTVAIGACGTVQLTVAVSCSLTMGQTLCATAHIYPDSVCTPVDTAWDGSTVAVEAACVNNDSVRLTISNTGSGDMQDSLMYYIIEDTLMVALGRFKLQSNTSINLYRPANGATIRIDAQQSTGHPGLSHPSASIELCGTNPGGGTSLGMITILPQDDADAFVAVTCEQVRTSYDPNDKTATPAGFAAEKYIPANTWIDYKIRFQNTGNDTAFKIVIRDTLTPLLDVTTVTSGASSHAYEFALHDESILEWTFDNILLPDSNIDEPGSHGFVQFRVAQMPGLANGTRIENFADIYFDFNAPVKTNVEFNTIGNIDKKPDPNAVRNFDTQTTITVAPNPFDDFITIELSSALPQAQFEIYNLQGKLLRRYTIAGDTFTLTNLRLGNGMYFYRLVTEGKVVGTGKLVR